MPRQLVLALSIPLFVTLFLPTTVTAQKPAPAVGAEGGGPAWSALTPAQKATLAPLQRDWSGIDGFRKQKWLELAEKYQSMPPAERQRVQERMTEWSRLTPEERTRARLQYQQARQMPAQDRQQHWDAYQALPSDEKQELAKQSKAAREAAPQPRSPKPAPAAASASAATYGAVPKAVSPAMVQARPGASTTLISNTPTGTPPQERKIVAPAGQVNRSTLLPKPDRPDAAAGSNPPASAARARL